MSGKYMHMSVFVTTCPEKTKKRKISKKLFEKISVEFFCMLQKLGCCYGGGRCVSDDAEAPWDKPKHYAVELDPETDQPLKGGNDCYAVHRDGKLVADGFRSLREAATFAGLANAIGYDKAKASYGTVGYNFNFYGANG